jgi:acyl-coenzyme A synthetase/AMP-(fatty) acid ligase
MTTPSADTIEAGASLSERVRAALDRHPTARPLLDDGRRLVHLDTLIGRLWINAPSSALIGRNLLLLTRDPVCAAVALVNLDGVAKRLIVCPPDFSDEDLGYVIETAGVDAIIHDRSGSDPFPLAVPVFSICIKSEDTGARLAPTRLSSEWVLFTSGTTGGPKMVVHSLAGLTDAFAAETQKRADAIVWATFYDIRRYGGLQMLLRALTGAHTMLLNPANEPMDRFLARLAASGATHVSGTPSHWRSALLSPALANLSPRYVRLSGEIADQTLLDRLARVFPNAAIGHAYASTEAGVAFEVNDGLEGFPERYLSRQGSVEMHVQGGTLRVRSTRTALRYLGVKEAALDDEAGFVDTGDLVENRSDRYYFLGRANGVINVGGLKVHPEEVEAVLNRHARVRNSLVKGRKSPITGMLVTAEVVLIDETAGAFQTPEAIRQDIIDHCRRELAAFKAPASIRFVDELAMTPGGKVERRQG